MSYPTKKLREFYGRKSGKGELLFDFYLNDQDAVIGRIDDFRKSELLGEIKNDILAESSLSDLRSQENERNFGYSADWPLIIVEWLAKDNWVNAVSNLGGLIAFSSYFFSLFTKLKSKYDDKLRVGIASARLIAFAMVFEKESENKTKFQYEILYEREIVRRGGFEEKDFVFLIRRTLENRDLLVFFIHIDWLGNIKNFYEI